jgi:undecaprenyl-diphosphatase
MRESAERAVVETLKAGGWSIVVLGGDGTVMQAAGAAVGTGTRICVVPGGTGNLLAGNLRIPSDPVRAARILLAGKTRRIDLGRVERDDGVHYFSVACGAGYDARVMEGTPTEFKRRWGFFAYVATTFRLIPLIKRVPHRITVDGVMIEVPASIAMVANCREIIPPLVKLKADVSFDDGMLDLILMSGNGFFGGVRAILDLLREHHTLDAEGGFVAHARGRHIRIESAVPQPVQIDGDRAGSTPLEASVVPLALDVCIP